MFKSFVMRLRAWMRRFSMSQRDRYFADAVDLADLETRMRRWEERPADLPILIRR